MLELHCIEERINQQRTTTTLISVVIPVYNSEGCLVELYKRLTNALTFTSAQHEIILVDDGSQDKSWMIISELSKQDSRVKGLRFSRNFGQHYGITAGLDHSNGDWVIIMDCDLQDHPEAIPQLYEKAKSGVYDIVHVKRSNFTESLVKKLSSKFFYNVLQYLSGMNYEDVSGNYCIISKCVLDNYRSMREQLRFFSGLINWTGFSVGFIEAPRNDRFDGKSTYTLKKRIRLAANAIIAYSDKPLRISIKLGFLIASLSLIFGSYILLRSFIKHIPVPGWSSLIISIYFLSGIIIANLGIIGIYLGKTFEEVKRRPLYIVKERTFNVA